MKKRALLMLPALALLLVACNNGGGSSESSSSGSSSSSTSQSSGSSESSSSSSSESSTTIPDPVPTGINSILEKPSFILKGETIDPSSVKLLINLDNGGTIDKYAESVDCDTSTASKGDVIKAKAHYKTWEIEFDVTVSEAVTDTLNLASFPSTTGSYKEKSENYECLESGATYKARIIKKTILAGDMMSFTDSSTKGQPGISTFKSNGVASKVTIKWGAGKEKADSTKDYNDGKKIYLFVGENNLPFVDVNDLSDKTGAYKTSNAVKVFEYDPENLEQTFSLPDQAFYVGIRASGSVVLESMSVSWVDAVKPAELSTMLIKGTVHAECSTDTAWKLDNVKVEGTYSDTKKYDITRYCELSADAVVPTTHSESEIVTVSASYLPDISKHASASLDGVCIEISSLTLSGIVSAETIDMNWDYSKVRVIATFNDESERDVTEEVDFGSSTPIPTEPTVEDMDVSVTAIFKKDNSKTGTATLKGTVKQGYPTAAAWKYKDTATGGTYSKVNMDNDTTKLCVKEQSTKDVVGYVQVFNSSASIMSADAATFVATIGAGSAKTFESEDYYVKVSLLSQTGDVIDGSTKNVASSLVKDATEYTVTYSKTELDAFGEIRGVRLSHKKVASYNVLFYSFKLTYLPA